MSSSETVIDKAFEIHAVVAEWSGYALAASGAGGVTTASNVTSNVGELFAPISQRVGEARDKRACVSQVKARGTPR